MCFKSFIAAIFLVSFSFLSSEQTRFSDNKDGTITDTKTGLVWLKNANFAGVTFDANDKDFFIKIAKKTNREGWRLPKESDFFYLLSDFKEAERIQVLKSSGFENIQSQYAFSNGINLNRWDILSNRAVDDHYHIDSAFVWPVCNPSEKYSIDNASRFVDSKKGFITDTKTGLVWMKNTSFGTDKTWDEAVKQASSVKQSGFNDWRLPSKHDFQLLFDGLTEKDNWKDFLVNAGFEKLQKWYWTSTPSSHWPQTACYYANVDSGFINVNGKKNKNSVWLVRGKSKN